LGRRPRAASEIAAYFDGYAVSAKKSADLAALPAWFDMEFELSL